MRIRAIACEVMARTLYREAALAPHVIDVELLEQALHDDRPASRLSRLQSQIDATPAAKYQAIVLLYGLCNLALEGLQARDLPVAVAPARMTALRSTSDLGSATTPNSPRPRVLITIRMTIWSEKPRSVQTAAD